MDETIKTWSIDWSLFSNSECQIWQKVANMNKSYNSIHSQKNGAKHGPNISNITARGTNINQKPPVKKDLSRFWLSCFSSFEIAHDWPWTAHYVRKLSFWAPGATISFQPERGPCFPQLGKRFTAYDNDISRMMATVYLKEIKRNILVKIEESFDVFCSIREIQEWCFWNARTFKMLTSVPHHNQ